MKLQGFEDDKVLLGTFFLVETPSICVVLCAVFSP